MNDNDVITLFSLNTVDTGMDTHRYERRKYVTQYNRRLKHMNYDHNIVDDETYKYIINRFSDISEPNSPTINISERLYRIAKGLDTLPVCENCGSPVKFQGLTGGYKKFCCAKCRYEYKGEQMRIHPKKEKQVKHITSIESVDDKLILDVFINGKTPKQTASLIIPYNVYAAHNGIITKNNPININIYEYLKHRYSDDIGVTETIYRIQHGINKPPKCPVCGNTLYFIGMVYGYREYCSRDCYETKMRIMKKENDLTKFNSKEEKYNITYKETFNKDVNDDIILEIFFNNKTRKQQNNIRTIYLRQINEHRLGRKITVYKDVIDYINNRFSDAESFQESLYRIYHHVEHRPVCKICGKPVPFNNGFHVFCSTKCCAENSKHNLLTSFNPSETSNAEKSWLSDFKKIYNNVVTSEMSAKTEYKDARYPFKYDFYIPEIDLFVEYQGFKVHGRHPYRGRCDIDELLYMIENSDIGMQDKIKYVWTENDVSKRRMAKENNLNFLELWPKDFYGKKRHKIIIDGIKEMQGKSKQKIQNIIKRISLYETIYDNNIYLG